MEWSDIPDMPTYDYKCERCGHEFEKFQRISDPPLKRCPECRGRIRRMIGAGAGILFKGSGFYTTDYRSESYRKAAKADTSPAPSGGGEKSKPAAAATPTPAPAGTGKKT